MTEKNAQSANPNRGKGSLTHLTGVSSQVVVACGSVLAGVRHTFVHLLLAIAARVARLTATEVCVARVQTLTGVTAQVSHLHTCSKHANTATQKVS